MVRNSRQMRQSRMKYACARCRERPRSEQPPALSEKWKHCTPTGPQEAEAPQDRRRKSLRSTLCSFHAMQLLTMLATRSPDMRLIDIAHARAGDKGNIVTLSLIAHRDADFPLLEQHVTADRVAQHFAEILDGRVIRYELPQLGALNFVLRRKQQY